MKSSLYILIGHIICAVKCATTVKHVVEKDIEVQKIRELEKEKSVVYKNINDAIEDTIATLEKSNDSDAREGISYMRELKSQITEFNGTEIIMEDDPGRNCTEDDSDMQDSGEGKIENNTIMHGGRRLGTGYEKVKEAILTFGKFSSLSGKIESKKKKARLENAIQLQKKLDAWMEQKEAERAKIRAYKSRLQRNRVVIVTEQCPDFGEAQVKAAKGSRSRTRLGKLPCCRKCCKKSYMGCLK